MLVNRVYLVYVKVGDLYLVAFRGNLLTLVMTQANQIGGLRLFPVDKAINLRDAHFDPAITFELPDILYDLFPSLVLPGRLLLLLLDHLLLMLFEPLKLFGGQVTLIL